MSLEGSDSLKGKLALITGCTGGIGYATALALAQRGCSIAVHYNSAEQKAKELVLVLEGLGVKAAMFQADLSTYDNVGTLHSDVVKALGNPDILFNNSGVLNGVIGPNGNIQDVSVEQFEITWRTNTGTAYLHGRQKMGQNSIQFKVFDHRLIGRFSTKSCNHSVAAGTGGVIGPHYASSKSAMHGLLHWIANRYAKDGITCNAVAPALIGETNMMSSPSEELRKKIPIGRFGRPQEVASVVELFATNAYLTNKIIPVDGGWAPSAF